MKNALSLLRVGVDLDGVLNNLGETVLTALKSRGLCPEGFTPDDVRDYDFEKCIPGLAKEELYKLFEEGDVFWDAEVDIRGLRVLQGMQHHGIQIHIVTSRDFSQRHRYLTAEWLREHNVPYDRLAIYGKRDKSIYAAAQKLDVFIEDHLQTAELVSDVVRLSILLDRPYNRIPAVISGDGITAGEYCNMVRMYSWADISRFFLGY